MSGLINLFVSSVTLTFKVTFEDIDSFKKISGISFNTRWNKIFFYFYITHFYCIHLLLWLKFLMLSRDLYVYSISYQKKSEEKRQVTRVFRFFFFPFPEWLKLFVHMLRKEVQSFAAVSRFSVLGSPQRI